MCWSDRGKHQHSPAESEAPCMCGRILHGTRETSELSAVYADWSEKGNARTADMNGFEGSDDPIILKSGDTKSGDTILVFNIFLS